MVLRLTSCSPRRPGFFVTVVSRIKVLSAPGWADLPPQDLTPALERQNHTTSPSASASFVQHAVRLLTGLVRLPCITSRAQRCRVHRIPFPTSVTIAKRPSVGQDAMDLEVIWVRREEKYFCKRGWTSNLAKHEVICPSGQIRLNPFKKTG